MGKLLQYFDVRGLCTWRTKLPLTDLWCGWGKGGMFLLFFVFEQIRDILNKEKQERYCSLTTTQGHTDCRREIL